MKTDAGVSRKYHEAGWWRDETFLDDLRRHAAERPGKTAAAARLVAQGRTETIDYAKLSRLTNRIAHGLVDLGIQPGEYISVQLHNGWEMLPLALACIQAGVRIAPVPPEYRRAELEYAFRLTGARLFVTAAELHGGRPAEVAVTLARELGLPEHVAVIGGGGPAGTLAFEEQFLAGPGGPEAELAGRCLDPDEPFLLLFTSGTTGENKGAMHSQNTLYSGIRGYTDAFGLDDSLVMTTPHTNMHYAGLVTSHLTAMFLGGTAVCADTSTPAVTLELIEQHGVTMLYGSPSYLREVLGAQRARPRDVSSLTCTVSGSAPVPPQLLDEVRESLGVRMFSLWGMSENGAVTITRPDDPPDWPAHSDGRPAGAMQIRIDPVAGREDGAGTLWVRGPSQCLGYDKRDDVYAADLDEDGWFYTGDLARDDGRGGIRIVGRAKDIIIYRSANVPVAEIEQVLGKHPKVRDVALIGIPDPAVDERVCAVVTPAGDGGPTLGELRDYLSEAGVSSWCWPERLEVIEAMPRTAMGKIRKADLRKRYPVM
jgi:cyclohexanecarboxylate-CoA ligase